MKIDYGLLENFIRNRARELISVLEDAKKLGNNFYNLKEEKYIVNLFDNKQDYNKNNPSCSNIFNNKFKAIDFFNNTEQDFYYGEVVDSVLNNIIIFKKNERTIEKHNNDELETNQDLENLLENLIEDNKIIFSYLYDGAKFEGYFEKCYNKQEGYSLDLIKDDIKDKKITEFDKGGNNYFLYEDETTACAVNTKTHNIIKGSALEDLLRDDPVE